MTTMTTIIEFPSPAASARSSRRALLTTTAVATAVLLAACVSPSTSVAATASHYVVQTRKAEGGFIEVGRLVLQPDGRADLTITATGTQAERLRGAWSDVSRRPSLATKARGGDGQLTGQAVTRGSPEFGAALADVMSREFGFFLSATDSRP